MSVTIIDTINNLDVTDDTIVTLKYEDSHEGWHSTGELESEAVRETCTADMVAELITDKTLRVKTSFGDELALEALRGTDLLEEYERGDFAFEQFIAETIRENPYDVDEFVEFNTEQYDHKRGSCTVSAEFTTTVAKLKEGVDNATGWTASFDHAGGTFSFDL
jgi:hypothetical protein